MKTKQQYDKQQIYKWYIVDKKPMSWISNQVFGNCYGTSRETIRYILTEMMGEHSLEQVKQIQRGELYDRRNIKLPLDKLRADYLTDMSNNELAEKYGVCREVIIKNLKLLGLSGRLIDAKRRNKRMRLHKEAIAKIKIMWNEGYSLTQIAETVNRAISTVKVYLQRMGYKTRYYGIYRSDNSDLNEKSARAYLEKQGIIVVRCVFMCQRNTNIPIPLTLRTFCASCPVRNIKFDTQYQEMYDYMCKDEQGYFVCEIKAINNTQGYDRSNFCLGQFINLGKIKDADIRFKLILMKNRGIIYEKWI